ncbi:hypothetical protein K7432_002901 [Basidiobolus ranarum]|uniref:ATR interacting protein n=1 Tax=Basidiobolus ranarum TaxID=34480 RepID=A0ABR2X0Z4_9FUNG
MAAMLPTKNPPASTYHASSAREFFKRNNTQPHRGTTFRQQDNTYGSGWIDFPSGNTEHMLRMESQVGVNVKNRGAFTNNNDLSLTGVPLFHSRNNATDNKQSQLKESRDCLSNEGFEDDEFDNYDLDDSVVQELVEKETEYLSQQPNSQYPLPSASNIRVGLDSQPFFSFSPTTSQFAPPSKRTHTDTKYANSLASSKQASITAQLMALQQEIERLKDENKRRKLDMDRMMIEKGEITHVRQRLSKVEIENLKLKENLTKEQILAKEQAKALSQTFQKEIDRLNTVLLFKEQEVQASQLQNRKRATELQTMASFQEGLHSNSSSPLNPGGNPSFPTISGFREAPDLAANLNRPVENIDYEPKEIIEEPSLKCSIGEMDLMFERKEPGLKRLLHDPDNGVEVNEGSYPRSALYKLISQCPSNTNEDRSEFRHILSQLSQELLQILTTNEKSNFSRYPQKLLTILERYLHLVLNSGDKQILKHLLQVIETLLISYPSCRQHVLGSHDEDGPDLELSNSPTILMSVFMVLKKAISEKRIMRNESENESLLQHAFVILYSLLEDCSLECISRFRPLFTEGILVDFFDIEIPQKTFISLLELISQLLSVPDFWSVFEMEASQETSHGQPRLSILDRLSEYLTKLSSNILGYTIKYSIVQLYSLIVAQYHSGTRIIADSPKILSHLIKGLGIELDQYIEAPKLEIEQHKLIESCVKLIHLVCLRGNCLQKLLRSHELYHEYISVMTRLSLHNDEMDENELVSDMARDLLTAVISPEDEEIILETGRS